MFKGDFQVACQQVQPFAGRRDSFKRQGNTILNLSLIQAQISFQRSRLKRFLASCHGLNEVAVWALDHREFHCHSGQNSFLLLPLRRTCGGEAGRNRPK
jgi:hypothetical protein